jgi:hypothetical protein
MLASDSCSETNDRALGREEREETHEKVARPQGALSELYSRARRRRPTPVARRTQRGFSLVNRSSCRGAVRNGRGPGRIAAMYDSPGHAGQSWARLDDVPQFESEGVGGFAAPRRLRFLHPAELTGLNGLD